MSIIRWLKPISISLSPNTEKDDVWLAFKLIFQPWRWRRGNEIELLEKQFKEYGHAFSFNSGRSAFLAILKSLDLPARNASPARKDSVSGGHRDAGGEKGDEVLLQAFTCNAVPNPVIWSGLKPVYIDCNEDDFNINVADLEKKITPKSRVVVIQHTFGLPADMDKILQVCRENNLILIEDCAHSLGAEYSARKVGTFGKAAFFSFSRDKVISSVYGGMAVTNDDELAKKLKEYQEKAGYPSCCWTFQQLLHPLAMNWKILPTYRIFGKYLLVLFQWLKILSKAVHRKEKRGLKPGYFPKRLPNALAILALNQFKKLERFNKHRKEISKIYFSELKNSDFELPKIFEERENVFLRFMIKHPRAHQIIKNAWNKNLLIGDWYTSPIAPDDTKLEKMGYEIGSCPIAEKLAKITFNLPTHINVSEIEAEKIIKFLKNGD